MDPLFILPIRFRYRQISRLLVPERTMVNSDAKQAQFDRLVARMTPLPGILKGRHMRSNCSLRATPII